MHLLQYLCRLLECLQTNNCKAVNLESPVIKRSYLSFIISVHHKPSQVHHKKNAQGAANLTHKECPEKTKITVYKLSSQ